MFCQIVDEIYLKKQRQSQIFILLSFLFLSLIIFFLCVNIIRIEKKNNIPESGIFIVEVNETSDDIAVSLKKFTTKTVKEANIDETEEYLNIRDTIIHVKINKKQS